MAVRLDRDYEPLPGYRLIERLGRGGFGEVWKVEAPGQLLKAMKFVFGNLDTHDEDDGRPAEQELKALNRVKAIRHPYILSLERIDIVEGQLIIVMELADRNLWDRFRECRQQKHTGVPREELLRYLHEAAEALDLMNDQFHIQHLDVKPQNLFLVHNHLKVADFGLAKAFEGGRGTITGGVTPVYAAPETFEGYASRFTDQYSLAIVFQELLTGTRPFNGSNTKQLLMQHLNGVPDLSALPIGDKPIIARALSKKPDDRWPNCVAMVQALSQSGLGDTPLPLTANAYAATAATPEGPHSPASPRTGYHPPLDDASPTLKTKIKGPEYPLTRPGGSGGSGAAVAVPRLVTPKAAAAAAAGRGPGMNSQTLNVTQRAAAKPVAPPEETGSGVLLPTLLVGVGHHGRLVVQRLRAMLRAEFGSLDAVPHLRFLLLDTDGEDLAEATSSDAELPLPVSDVLHVRLNRPAHYLQRDGLPPVEPWMPPGLLYKLPKEPKHTGGVRAFGRLAFLDHVRAIVARVRADLREFAGGESLAVAARQTGHTLRTNRPRAYVVAATTGGTGGGMALDLAYLLKTEFRRAGYATSPVCGVLLVPPADKTKPKGPALANTYALLSEVAHYATEGAVYQSRFDANEPPITDSEGPFARCTLIQLPNSANSSKLGRTIGLVARGLWMDLMTPVGRVTDTVRTEAFALPRKPGPVIQTFGLFRFTWPRFHLLETLTRRFGSQLLRRWAGKEAAHLREPIRQWLGDQWVKRELPLEDVVEKFNLAIESALREKPERVFDAFVDPLRVRLQGAGKFDESATCDVLEELLKLVGKPDPEQGDPGKIEDTLRATGKRLAIESEGHLSALAVSFIEQPQYRLAGADEALNQVSDKLTQVVDTLMGVRKGLIKDVYDCYQKLFDVIDALTKDATGFFGGRRSGYVSDLCDLLRRYPRLRLKLAVLDATAAFYRGLLIQCPDYHREISSCRVRLEDLSMKVEGPAPAREGRDEPTAPILPPGCDSLAAAADEFLNALPPDDILAFETEFQKQMSLDFRGVVYVCTRAGFADDFLKLLSDRARAFLDPRVERADPAAMFFRYKDGQPGTAAELEGAFDQAAPDLTSINGAAPAEATVLAAPSGESGDLLRQFISAQLEGVEFIPAPLASDVVLYREYPLLELANLPQLADHAREAYVARLGTDHPPHARADVPWSLSGDSP
jgi:serine/threonine protein kinase